MSLDLPRTLSRLQSTREGAERDTAWGEFVAAHSDVVLYACRSAWDHDAAMDAYVFVLEALRENDYRRLRAYVPDGKTQFTTWLLVVSRRLALDHIRHRYGRSRSQNESRRGEQITRRRLEDLLSDEIKPDELPGASATAPDAALRREQLTAALRAALNDLEPEARLLLALRYADDRSVRDIARTMHLPSVFHVYRRLSATLSRLRASLARHGVDEAEP